MASAAPVLIEKQWRGVVVAVEEYERPSGSTTHVPIMLP
jgi:hypothetical protein